MSLRRKEPSACCSFDPDVSSNEAAAANRSCFVSVFQPSSSLSHTIFCGHVRVFVKSLKQRRTCGRKASCRNLCSDTQTAIRTNREPRQLSDERRKSGLMRQTEVGHLVLTQHDAKLSLWSRLAPDHNFHSDSFSWLKKNLIQKKILFCFYFVEIF